LLCSAATLERAWRLEEPGETTKTKGKATNTKARPSRPVPQQARPSAAMAWTCHKQEARSSGDIALGLQPQPQEAPPGAARGWGVDSGGRAGHIYVLGHEVVFATCRLPLAARCSPLVARCYHIDTRYNMQMQMADDADEISGRQRQQAKANPVFSRLSRSQPPPPRNAHTLSTVHTPLSALEARALCAL
jgi:hypothetical protein